MTAFERATALASLYAPPDHWPLGGGLTYGDLRELLAAIPAPPLTSPVPHNCPKCDDAMECDCGAEGIVPCSATAAGVNGPMSTCDKCGAKYPSAPAGAIHKCGRCSGGMCVPDEPPLPMFDPYAHADGSRECRPIVRGNGRPGVEL